MTISEQAFECSGVTLFDVIADPSTYPRWLVGAKHIRSVSPSWPSPESFFEHTVGFGPIVIPDRTTVRAIEPPTSLELLVRARPVLEAVVRFDVIDAESGCLLRMTETPVGVYRLVSPCLQPLIRARNSRSLDRLAELVGSR